MKVEKLNEELLVDGDGLLSDDSSFYGPPSVSNSSRPLLLLNAVRR